MLAAIAAAGAVLFTSAGSGGKALAENRHAAMVIDANTGEVLHASAADEPRHPASLTKMMTLYIAFGEIEAGRLSYETLLKVSEAAASVSPSKLELEPGAEITLIDAIKSLVTKSANDMAVAIAEKISGNEDAFAKLMTDRAHQIGMRATTFRNASGLPDDAQVTTARDMLTLALHLQDDFPKHYRLFSLKYFTYNGETHRNHNTLLFHYEGTDGIKTGYTRDSGFNLVTSVRRDGRHVVGAVFGGETSGTRNAQMRMILTRALQKASSVKTRKPAPLLIAKPKPVQRPAVQLALKTPPRAIERPKPTQVAIAPAAKPAPVEQPKPAVAAAIAANPANPQQAATAAPLKAADTATPTASQSPAVEMAPEMWNSRGFGVEYANWLLFTTQTTGS